MLPLRCPNGVGCSCVVDGPVGARCAGHDKPPATRHGAKDATTDRARIRRWWSRRRWNLGVATGGGVLVLDIDPRHAGDVALDTLEAAHGCLPRGVVACAKSGGSTCGSATTPLAVASRAARGRSGRASTCAEGGLVVAPPPVHASGRTYGWELSSDPEDVALDDAPACPLGASARGAEAGRGRRVGERARGVAVSWPAGELIPTEERNAALYRCACLLRAAGLDAGALLAALLDENQARCVPPLAEDEVEKIAANAARHSPGLSRGFQAQRSRGEHAAELAARFGRRSA